MYKSE
ncbi:hypothetical protein CP03DC29_0720A, partial [Chlamydia psittaci 03DC29]